MWSDSLLILLISTCTAALGEGLSWLLIYRTEKYQKLKIDVEKQSKKRKLLISLFYPHTANLLSICLSHSVNKLLEKIYIPLKLQKWPKYIPKSEAANFLEKYSGLKHFRRFN